MMKKLVVLAFVAIASVANAAIVSSIEFVQESPGVYGIVLPAGMSAAVDASGGYFYVTGVDLTKGAMTGSAPDASGILGNSADFGFEEGVLGFIGSYGTTWSVAGNSKVVSGLVANAPVLNLYSVSDDFTTATLVDSVPEPATMALLGLGGLFFARRK